MEYKVLNDFTAANGAEFKKDALVNSEDTTLPAEEIAALIVAGNLDPIIDESLMEDVVVDKAWLDANPDAVTAGIKLGDTVKQAKTQETAPELTPEEAAAKEAADAAEAAAKVADDEAAAAAAKEAAGEDAAEKGEEVDASQTEAGVAPEKKLTYRGQDVITDGMRTVNGVDYHHLRLADGSMTDVTDEEYAAMVSSAQ